MFVDASALTAILTDETDAAALAARLQRALRRVTSPLAVWETGVAVARHLDLPVPAAREAVHAPQGHLPHLEPIITEPQASARAWFGSSTS